MNNHEVAPTNAIEVAELEQQRVKLIPALDNLLWVASRLQNEFDIFMNEFRPWDNKSITKASNTSHALVNDITAAKDALTRQGEGLVKDYIVDWWHFHVEDDNENPTHPDPIIESLEYKGHDRWEAVMTTVEEGRQKVSVDHDGVHGIQVYDSVVI